MQEITRAQEEILKAVWEAGSGAVSDILDRLPDPKPAYNTVATVIKVLEKKGYLDHRTYGKTNVYSPLVSKADYAQHVLKDTLTGLFNRSVNQMVSPLIKNRSISISELEELREMIEAEINKQRS
jgi:BlaI family transcriptional regulator, penicillinase repressor